MTNTKTIKKSLLNVTLITAALLVIPFIARMVTEEVVWNLFDFIFAGALIFGTGSSYVLISRLSDNFRYRIAIGIALVTALLLVWTNAAVGIIGSENNSINLMYFGVVLILIFGAFIARFRAKGLANALFVTAVIQASTILIAIFADKHISTESSVIEIIVINGFFVTLFMISGGLFWQIRDESIIEKEDA